eukprot:TRINITY_DN16835_c0_g4_i1.p1 TRINITY_DN16835_c0_g4~~TRINITY_DN16835_c0_g4_i1.p1  ORF type:complete len:525 (+),score=89.02 TRINITY_DN16835_c0_g4_i1:37-1575(+)
MAATITEKFGAASAAARSRLRRPTAPESLTTASTSRSSSPDGNGSAAFIVRNTFIDGAPGDSVALLHERSSGASSCPAGTIGGLTLQVVEEDISPEPEVGSPECPTVGSAGHDAGTCKPCAFLYTKGCTSGINCKFCHLCGPGEKKRRAKELKQLRRQLESEKQSGDAACTGADLCAGAVVDSAPNGHKALEVSTNDEPSHIATPATVSPARSQSPLAASPPIARRCPSCISTSTSSGEHSYVVRNTFIDEPCGDNMLEDRRGALSCPAARVGCFDFSKFSEDEHIVVPFADEAGSPRWPATPAPEERQLMPSMDEQLQLAAMADAYLQMPMPSCFYERPVHEYSTYMPVFAAPTQEAPTIQPHAMPPPPTTCADQTVASSMSIPPMTCGDHMACNVVPAMFDNMAPAHMEPTSEDSVALAAAAQPSLTSRVLHLSEALEGPELGSAECPTRGSAGHRAGLCKPCAFFHKQGCGNGVNCDFCHLCDSGEKKRRQKEKKAALRAMQELATFSQ